MKVYDVVIIGGGVVGLTQAVALSQMGLRVALVDAHEEPKLQSHPDPRVYAINRSTENYLKCLSIWQNIPLTKCSAYQHMRLCLNAHPTLQFNASDDAEPDLGHILEENTWRLAAFEALLKFDQTDCYWGYALESWTYDPSQQTSQITLHSTHDNVITHLHTTLLIGADGRDSQVRKLANIPVQSFPSHQTACIFTIETEKPHQQTAWQFFTPQGIIACLPLPHSHQFSLVWSMPDSQKERIQTDSSSFINELDTIFHHTFGKLTEISTKRFSFPLIQQQAKTYTHDGIVLIGDAAHGIHPYAGQGANLGVADVKELTQQLKLIKTKHRSLSDNTFLKIYSRHRRSAAWQMMHLMDIISRSILIPSYFKTSLQFFSQYLNFFMFPKNLLTRFALYDFNK